MLQEMRNLIQMAIESKKINDKTLKDGVVHLCAKEICRKYLLVINNPRNADLVNSFISNYPNSDIINECKAEKSKFLLNDLLVKEIQKDEPNADSLVEYIKSQVIIIRNDDKMKDFKELMRMGAKLAGGSAPGISKINTDKNWANGRDIDSDLSRYFEDKTQRSALEIERMFFGSKNIVVEVNAAIDIEERPFFDSVKQQNIQYFHNLLKESKSKISKLIDMNLIFSGVKMRYEQHYSRKVDGLAKFTARSLQIEGFVKYSSGYTSMTYDPINTETRDFLYPAKVGMYEIGNTDNDPAHSKMFFRMKFYIDYDKFINTLIEEHESFE